MLRHLPNLLSALRLAMAPFAAWLILNNHDTASLLVFAAAGASDALDGYIARTYGFTSAFGAWLDPAADKLLMLLCFSALWAVGATPLLLVALVVARDAAIAAGWLVVKAASLPVTVRALPVGKLSTAVQLLYIFTALLLLAFDLKAEVLMTVFAWICGLVTVAAGGAYAGLFLRGLFSRGAAAP